jgi:hypothetical protein
MCTCAEGLLPVSAISLGLLTGMSSTPVAGVSRQGTMSVSKLTINHRWTMALFRDPSYSYPCRDAKPQRRHKLRPSPPSGHRPSEPTYSTPRQLQSP